jgi:transcriptional regulator with GAF, ATPase, and Fis domain/tetratricopeptide (TPR) repeat protein
MKDDQTNQKKDDPANGTTRLEDTLEKLDSELSSLATGPEHPRNNTQFVSSSLEFTRVCFVLGKGFNRSTAYLKDALLFAQMLGDKRSEAMINLHLGRLYYFATKRNQAMDAFLAGKKGVDELGDEDITSQASELIGFFYFIQGHITKAAKYFEHAANKFEVGEHGHSGPLWLSYCQAFIGQFHRATGTLAYFQRLANERGNKSVATTLKSILGIILVKMKDYKEGYSQLSTALEEARTLNNAFGEYMANGGLGLYYMTQGELEKSKKCMSEALLKGAELGLIRLYASPALLEVLFEYHKNGMTPIPDFSFQQEAERILIEPNIYSRGVILRLKALDAQLQGKPFESIKAKLEESEGYLEISGGIIELAKTRIEMARLHLEHGDEKQAGIIARKAWKGFSGYGDVFYPDDLRHLLVVKNKLSAELENRREMLQKFTNMLEELVVDDNLSEILTRTVKATNLFLGAERGGIFLFNNTKKKGPPKLIAAHNLFESDISRKVFLPNLTLIFKAFHKNKPFTKHYKENEGVPGKVTAMIAIPFEIQGMDRGILYHDNAYINDNFDNFSKEQLSWMTNAIGQYVTHVLNLTRQIKEKASRNISQLGQTEKKNIIAQSRVMKSILQQADKVAATPSTVLILGETGVGKELLARRIHDMSPRRDRPMVTVDPSSIPETLVESELFGHEKGAFTGADSQRQGRIELADKGTLFIDEVGEISLSVQVKLLRALQEKTISRLGGTKVIHSDFRLIGATNKDLLEEIKKGNFREDLYYRINVIPLTLPSLKDRGEDIIILSEYFLNQYGAKYNRPSISLTQENKNTLMRYDWPGNIRELKNIIERAVLLSTTDSLKLDLKQQTFNSSDYYKDTPSLDEMQRRYIAFAIKESDGKIGGKDGAAERLGMKRTSLYARMKTLGLK